MLDLHQSNVNFHNMTMIKLNMYCCVALTLLCCPIYGQISDLPEKDAALTQKITGKYDKFVFKCDTALFSYTAIYPTEWGLKLVQGFIDPENSQTSSLFLMVNDSLKLTEYVVNTKIDTLTSVDWRNCETFNNENNISVLEQKAIYSYILHQFKESGISQEGFPCVRLLVREGASFGSYKWNLVKLNFRNDSIAFLKQVMKLDNNSMGIYTVTDEFLDYNDYKLRNLNLNLKKLQSFNGIELLDSFSSYDHYPFLLEYFDGSESKVFIYSNKKNLDKDFSRVYGKVIKMILNL